MRPVVALCTAAMLVFFTHFVVAGQEAKSHGNGSKDKYRAAHNTLADKFPLRGVAHVGIQVSDLQKSRSFYHDVLGFEEVFDRRIPGSQEVTLAFFKINDRQFIEIVPGLRPDPGPQHHPLCGNVHRRHCQAAQAAARNRRTLSRAQSASHAKETWSFPFPHPPGLELSSLDFVQYMPGSLHSADPGKRPW